MKYCYYFQSGTYDSRIIGRKLKIKAIKTPNNTNNTINTKQI